MTPPYTRWLGYGSVTGPADQHIYTAPEGYTVVIRDLIVGGTDDTLYFNFYYQAGSDMVWLFRAPFTIETRHLELRQVLPVGAELIINGNGDLWTYAVTGYVLQGG